MSNNSVLIMAGGTGGHVFPGIALADEMRARGYQINWLGTENGLEARLVPNADIPLHFIPVKGIRGKGLKSLFMAPWNIISSVISALKIIKDLRPSIVVGLGGFVAGPGGVAAKILGIPLLIHEQNAVAGTTNRLLAKIAKRVLCAFPCQLKNAQCIGNPVRASIETLAAPDIRLANREGNTRVLILGGSRGALAINEIVPETFGLIDAKRLDIWHQAGAQKEAAAQDAYRNAGVDARVEAFIDDMAEAFAWADIVICRSGALTVSELSAVGLGAIFIPFPYAIDDHQTANAKYLQEGGAAIIRQQKDITSESLAQEFKNVLFDRELILDMARKARAMSKPQAAQTFANHCEELVHG